MVFQCINIRQVHWEVLKTAAFGLGFQHLPRDLENVNAWKIMFDPFIPIQFLCCGSSFTVHRIICLVSWKLHMSTNYWCISALANNECQSQINEAVKLWSTLTIFIILLCFILRIIQCTCNCLRTSTYITKLILLHKHKLEPVLSNCRIKPIRRVANAGSAPESFHNKQIWQAPHGYHRRLNN